MKRTRTQHPQIKEYGDLVDSIKKMIEDWERDNGPLPRPVSDPLAPYAEKLQGVGFHDYDQDPCAYRRWAEQHPDHSGPLMLVCTCRRCNVVCSAI